MVRPWLAEELVARDPAVPTLEEAGEKCFQELLFLGYMRPIEDGAADKVRHCKMDSSIKKFVLEMSQSENFVSQSQLPYHLEKQVDIRKLVRKQMKQPPPEADTDHKGMLTAACGICTTKGGILPAMMAQPAEKKEAPLDKMVDLLEKIQVNNKYYRLNVLDLGGCKGLRNRHISTICEVRSLKYLSLRNTDISVLPPRKIRVPYDGSKLI
jgi:hypothetical protein